MDTFMSEVFHYPAFRHGRKAIAAFSNEHTTTDKAIFKYKEKAWY